MALRLLFGLFIGFALMGAVACSDDDNGSSTGATANTGSSTSTGSGQPPASQPDYCDNVAKVKSDVDAIQSAAVSLNRSGVETAVANLKTDISALRAEVRSGSGNTAVDQAAADLSGAVDGLETTLRQAGQGDASLLGVAQQLATQIPVIVSSMSKLQSEARCN